MATRLPPAASSYAAGPIVAKTILVDLETLRTPAAKPPAISYQLVSEAEMTMPTVPDFVDFAARMPAR